MKYQITITKVEEVEATEHGPYTVIDARPWTKNEIGQQNFFGQSENDLAHQPRGESAAPQTH